MTAAHDRIRHLALREKIMTAAEAAEFVHDGMLVGMSGFTGAGYPKALPTAIAERAQAIHAEGKPFQISVITGASTAPECDGVLAASGSLKLRSPFQSDPTLRNDINAGKIAYTDIHLSQIEQQVRFGFFGAMDVAIIEVVGITEEGKLIPSMSVGPDNQWVKSAQKIILEVNTQQHAKLETMHDVFPDIGTPPHRRPLLLLNPDDRIGSHYIDCDLDKIVAIVFTDAPDRNSKFAEPDAVSQRIAAQIIDFFEHEVKHGRLPENLLPLQSGVGNVANAVLADLQHSRFENITGFTEVLQDGMLDLLLSGKMASASATALSFSPDALQRFNDNIDFLRDKIVLRPMEFTNSPEVIRRLGVIGMNAMIEADLYGNVNSTHIMGTKMMNGIGGSGDFCGERRRDFLHCADGIAPRPHRTRCNVHRYRARHGRPARQIAPPTRTPHHRQLCAPRLPRPTARLFQPRRKSRRLAHAAFAERSPFLAPTLRGNRRYAREIIPPISPH